MSGRIRPGSICSRWLPAGRSRFWRAFPAPSISVTTFSATVRSPPATFRRSGRSWPIFRASSPSTVSAAAGWWPRARSARHSTASWSSTGSAAYRTSRSKSSRARRRPASRSFPCAMRSGRACRSTSSPASVSWSAPVRCWSAGSRAGSCGFRRRFRSEPAGWWTHSGARRFRSSRSWRRCVRRISGSGCGRASGSNRRARSHWSPWAHRSGTWPAAAPARAPKAAGMN